MSEHPRDEFDDVPEDGARQGAHRGHNPRAREGSTRQFRTVLVSGVLALVLGAVCFVNAPRTAQEAQSFGSVAVSPVAVTTASPVTSASPVLADAAAAGQRAAAPGGVEHV